MALILTRGTTNSISAPYTGALNSSTISLTGPTSYEWTVQDAVTGIVATGQVGITGFPNQTSSNGYSISITHFPVGVEAAVASLLIPANATDTATNSLILTCANSGLPNGAVASQHQADYHFAPVGAVQGCTNPAATNYNPLATVDDGSCILPVRGCTNSAATNYNRLATVDDGSCVFPVVTVGCTDPRATNYNPTATIDDGSCVLPALPVRGCTDPAAINYNGLAAQSDGSCQYAVPVPTQAPPFVAACPCLWTATLLPIKAWAIVVPPVGTWIQKPC